MCEIHETIQGKLVFSGFQSSNFVDFMAQKSLNDKFSQLPVLATGTIIWWSTSIRQVRKL